MAQATVCLLALQLFHTLFFLFIHFSIFLSIDRGGCYVFTRPVMGSVCIWPGWSLGWFDYTHGVAYGCRHPEVILFVNTSLYLAQCICDPAFVSILLYNKKTYYDVL